MDINVTIFCEFVIFSIFLTIVKKKIWPPFLAILEERKAKIAAGLEAAEKGQQALAHADHNAALIIQESREKAQVIIDQAQQQVMNLKAQTEEEMRVFIQESKEKAASERAELMDAFLQEAKDHYADVALEVCTVVLGKDLNKTQTQKLIKSALVEMSDL